MGRNLEAAVYGWMPITSILPIHAFEWITKNLVFGRGDHKMALEHYRKTERNIAN